ncbi:unnamed protein product [Peniophora sp. CBMAI 1063]|nr:unnamed protein product [Peniophora sp. CBMAI 1063]
MDPSNYFSHSKSSVFTAGPVYFDPRTETFKAIGIKPGEFLVSPCTCDERNTLRMNCEHKHILAPRELAVRVVRQGDIGYGVRAKQDIKRGTCLGIYAGELVTGLENMELAKSLQIAPNVNLGFAAYLDPTLWQLPDDTEDATESTMSETTSTSTPPSFPRRVENILAAHKVNGQVHLLVCWEGHTALTWEPDDGLLKHNLTCEGLESDLPDDSAEFQEDIGPEAYAMASGVLNAQPCCKSCEEEQKNKEYNREAFDRRAYIRASRLGNVRTFDALLWLILIVSTVYSLYSQPSSMFPCFSHL